MGGSWHSAQKERDVVGVQEKHTPEPLLWEWERLTLLAPVLRVTSCLCRPLRCLQPSGNLPFCSRWLVWLFPEPHGPPL